MTWINVLLSAVTALVLMYILFQGFDAFFLVLFVVNLMLAEIFVQIRWRLSVVCPHCGFDPILYRRDHGKACEKVKNKLNEQVASGSYLLRISNPLQNLPKLSVKSKENPLLSNGANKSSGNLIDKTL